MKRWIGLGVVADNLINIGHAMQIQSIRSATRAQPRQPAGHSRRVLLYGAALITIPKTSILRLRKVV
jgi:hypothetical protein